MIARRSLLALDFGPRRAPADAWLRVHRTAMACRVEVALHPGDGGLLPAAYAALDEADRVEALLTVFRDSSELARVNREGANGCDQVDSELLALLERCQRLTDDTEGAFDVTSTPLSRCWGFLRREPRVPSEEEIASVRRVVGMSRVRIDHEGRCVKFTSAGVELNANAIGKGYALDRMASVLQRFGGRCALLSAGASSVVAVGGPAGGWRIDVRSPVVGAPIARVRLRDGALGTSGAGEQFVIAEGTRYGHVIDPRTGWPASGVVSASVVAADGAAADALSTAFLIGGAALAERYCCEHPNVLALVVTDPAQSPRVYGGYAGARLEHPS